MSDIDLNGVEFRALKELSTYRYLTRELMQATGVGSDPNNLGERLQRLARLKLINHSETAPFLSGVGRVPRLYWLTQRGADVLSELSDAAPVAVPRHRPTTVDERPHRIAIIETHIAVRKWVQATHGVELRYFTAEYHPGQNGRRKATTVSLENDGDLYSPDAYAEFQVGPDRIFVVFEIYRGGRSGSLSHFKKQLPRLEKAARSLVFENHLNLKRRTRFAVIFSTAAMAANGMQNWPRVTDDIWDGFFVRSMEGLNSNFNGNWLNPKGQPAPLVPV